MSVETDAHGRLYLSAELRQKYGEKFHVVEYEDRLELIAIDDALEGKSRPELREDALARANQEAEADRKRDKRDVVTSPIAYREMLIVPERRRFDYVRLFANLLDLVPVGPERLPLAPDADE